MLQDQCISVTDLRTNTKQCLEGLDKNPKYVFINNKPIAVILDIETFEAGFSYPEFRELSEDEVTPAMKHDLMQAKKLKKADLINI